MGAHHTCTGHTFLRRFYVSDAEAATHARLMTSVRSWLICLIVKTGQIAMSIDPTGSWGTEELEALNPSEGFSLLSIHS